MTADVRDWLRQLTDTHAKATPGPWATYWGDHLGSGVTVLPGGGVMVDHFITTIADEDYRADSDNKPNPASPDADAAAIVSAHNAFPELLRLAAEGDAIKRAVLDLADEWEARNTAALRQRLTPTSRRAAEEAIEAAHILRAAVAAAGGQA